MSEVPPITKIAFDFGTNPDGSHRWAMLRPLTDPDFLACLAELRAANPDRHDRSARVCRSNTMRAIAAFCFAPIHGAFRFEECAELSESVWFDDAGRVVPSSTTVQERLEILSLASLFADVMLVLRDRETFAPLTK